MQVSIHILPQRCGRQVWEAWREMLGQGLVEVWVGGILGDEPMIEANHTVAAFEYT